MTSAENIAAKLRELLERGVLPRSQCGAAFTKAIQPLLDSGVIEEQKSNAGRRLVARDPASLESFFRAMFPDLALDAAASRRVAGVAYARDSKTFRSDSPEIVLARAWSDDALRAEGRPVQAAAATTAHGVFAFALRPNVRHIIHGPCALVENPAVFHAFEKLETGIPLALFGCGKISDRMLSWLDEALPPGQPLIHFPDYDPAGLTEFARLKRALADRARLHLPENLSDLFSRLSNRSLLHPIKSQSLFATLRRSGDSQIRAVLELIEKHNAGLEQEALLAKASSREIE